MVNIMTTASELGYITFPDNILIDIEQMRNYPDEQIVLITTGSQGEAMAALSRIAASLHRKISIKPGDTVILSSTPIPGNEKSVSKVINELSRKGAKVIFQDTHVSGHACQEEIKLMYALLRPKFAIPVHGEFRHLIAHAELADSMGVDKRNIFILSSGDVLAMTGQAAKVIDAIPLQEVLVDGLGVGDVGNVVLRDRQLLSENGLIIVVVTLDRYSGQLLAGPEIVSRGFVYVKESEDLLGETRELAYEVVEHHITRGNTDWNRMKNDIRDALGEHFWKKMKRKPMILPIITEVD